MILEKQITNQRVTNIHTTLITQISLGEKTTHSAYGPRLQDSSTLLQVYSRCSRTRGTSTKVGGDCIFTLSVCLSFSSRHKKLSYCWQIARRAYRSVKVTKHGTIPYVRYGFLLVFYSNSVSKFVSLWDIRLQKWCDFENRAKGPWRSLKMSPFDFGSDPAWSRIFVGIYAVTDKGQFTIFFWRSAALSEICGLQVLL